MELNFNVNALPKLIPFLLQISATIILFLILRHFLFKPVTEFLNKRQEGIAKDLDEASKNRNEAETLREQYELKIQEAKKEGQLIIEAAKKRGEELRENIIAEANNDAKNIVEKAKKEIETEREKAVDHLKSEVVAIAMMAASKVIDKNLDENAHKNLINQFINEVGEGTWQN